MQNLHDPLHEQKGSNCAGSRDECAKVNKNADAETRWIGQPGEWYCGNCDMWNPEDEDGCVECCQGKAAVMEYESSYFTPAASFSLPTRLSKDTY